MTPRSGSRLERILRSEAFVVTAEVVPPKSADPAVVQEQAKALIGYADAVNVTDNPAASAHMSAVAGAALAAAVGLEPIAQVTSRDRNRLAITADLLGAWAVGARSVLCLTGDPVAIGDHPDAREVGDLSVLDLVRLAVRLREEGTLLSGATIDPAPRYFVGVADVPLQADYDPGRLEAKAEAGADFVQTQIAYDVDALGEWVERLRPRGILERMSVLVGVAPPRGPSTLRFMREHLQGVLVPDSVMERLESAGAEAPTEGVRLAVEIIAALREVTGIAGVHVMGLGHEEAVRRVIEDSGLLPRPEPDESG